MSFGSPATVGILLVSFVLSKSSLYCDNTMMDSLDGDNTHAGDITRRLKQEHIRVIEEENKLHLLTTLKKRGLSTRDIMAFIKKQADNRTILKSLDKGLASRAMTYKIRDCKSVLFVHRKNRSDLKTEYIRSTGGKKYHIRRILRSARNEYNKQDLRSKQKMEKKNPTSGVNSERMG